MQESIIIKPSVEKLFEHFMRQGRVLFFSAPCGFGKTAVAEALLSSREVLRLSADSAGFKLPSAEADWQILLLDDLQDMQDEQDSLSMQLPLPLERVQKYPVRHSASRAAD